MLEQFSPPPLYEPVVVAKIDSARAHAERLAQQGAEEGTLVWAQSQTEGLGRNGQRWMSGRKNLHLALILRPDHDPFATVCQLSLVATICAAIAIAEQAEPMSELRYRWPNDVLLNRGKVAGITLSGQRRDTSHVEWMVLGLNVNVWEHPTSLGFESASMRGEGFEMHDRAHLAESFCRQFLSWADRWANEGFAPVRKAWLTRGKGNPVPQTVKLFNDKISGILETIDQHGAAVFRTTQTNCRNITLAEFFCTDFLPTP